MFALEWMKLVGIWFDWLVEASYHMAIRASTQIVAQGSLGTVTGFAPRGQGSDAVDMALTTGELSMTPF